MKPDFALSLSQEGIVLFHRTAGRWNELGTVPVDSTDLLAELASLREKGIAAADLDRAAALPCKIVMPNDLVRYIAIDNPRASESEVLSALDGTTPYRIAELAHDHRVGGGRTHIAAVARTNLDEAEAFATEHGFAPVAFVATPEPFTFPGEVNFGPTRIAATILPEGDTFEPDDEGVPITPAAFAAEIHAPATGTTVAGAGDEALPTPPPAPKPEEPAEEPEDSAPGAELASTVVQPPLPDAEGISEDAADETRAEEDRTAEGAPDADAPDLEGGPPPVFASRSRPQGIAPAPPRVIPAPPAAPAPKAEDKSGEPVFSRRSPRPEGESGRQEASLAALPVQTGSPAALAPAVLPEAGTEGEKIIPLAAPVRPVTTPAMPGQHAARSTEPAPEPARPRRRIGLGLVLTLVLLAVLAAIALWSTTLEGGLSAFLDNNTRRTAAAPPAEVLPADPVAAAGEAEVIATSGLDPAAGPGPEAASQPPELPDDPGADAGVPGSSAMDVNERGPERPDLAMPDADGAGGTGLPFAATEPDVSGLLARGEARGEDRAGTAPDAAGLLAAAAGAAVIGTLVAPEEVDRVYESTGVWLRAPRLPLLPRGDTLEELNLSAADPARATDAPVPLSEGPGTAPDPGLPQQPDPPPAGTTVARDARGLIVATPEGVLLPTGITVFAGAPPRDPPTRPGTPPPPPAIEAAALVEASGIRPPARPDSILEAATAAGMVEPVVEEDEQPAEAVDEVTEDDESAALATPAGGTSLALVAPDLRPRTRPASVVPPPPWEGVPPPNRPASLASLAASGAQAETAGPATEDVLSATLSAIAEGPDPLAGVTASAVPQAQRPDMRPRNFSRVVQTQTEILARASTATPAAAPAPAPEPAVEPAPAPAAAPAAAPATSGSLTTEEAAEAATEVSTIAAPATGPTPGGAAQAATVSRAINLREINLIGVFGPQSARRALIRLANGRLVRVGVGDSLDGGQVVAIGDSFLNYAKRGQTYTLQVPG